MLVTPNCPDCEKPMQEGFVPDFSYDTLVPTHWHPGAPDDPARFRELGAETKTIRIEDARRILVYCCPECGLLRSYAQR